MTAQLCSWLEKICRKNRKTFRMSHWEGVARLGGAEWPGVEPTGPRRARVHADVRTVV